MHHFESKAALRRALVERCAAGDLVSLADLVFTTFEGAFILVRTLGDPDLMRGQLAHLRRYVELVFELDTSPAAWGEPVA